MTPAEAAYSRSEQLSEQIDERNRLVMEELPQVYYIAARIRDRLPQHVPLEDLVNAGVLGLLAAFRNYDSSKRVQFTTFAKFRIRGAILDSLREMDWASRPLRKKGRQIDEAATRLEAKLGRKPNEQEIADEIGISLERFRKFSAQIEGLDLVGQQVAAPYDRSENHDVIESAPSRGDDNPFDLCLQGELKQQLVRAIAELPEREQMVISLYYREELTMKEIAAVLKVAESRVSQLHSLAMSKLRTAMRPAGEQEKTTRTRAKRF